MKQTLEGVLKYLRKNYCSYWIILGIDTAIAVLCTWIAYIGIYSMTGISVRTRAGKTKCDCLIVDRVDF